MNHFFFKVYYSSIKRIRRYLISSFFLLFLFIYVQPVLAYEPYQLEDCIQSAKQNNAIKGVTETAIAKYCNCALDLIIDQEKDVRESGYQCAIISFSDQPNT